MIKGLLETDLSCYTISNQIIPKANSFKKVNFLNTKYSAGQKYHFPYSCKTAYTVI